MVGESSFTAADEEIHGAEDAYRTLEEELRRMIADYETTTDYDEYIYTLDEIGHDPYELIALLSALYPGEWTLAEVRETLETVFWKQYRLSENCLYETRYRTLAISEPPYAVQEPYRYTVCTLTLRNHSLSEVAAAYLTPEQMETFALYMETHGLRSDLFGETESPMP